MNNPLYYGFGMGVGWALGSALVDYLKARFPKFFAPQT